MIYHEFEVMNCEMSCKSGSIDSPRMWVKIEQHYRMLGCAGSSKPQEVMEGDGSNAAADVLVGYPLQCPVCLTPEIQTDPTVT